MTAKVAAESPDGRELATAIRKFARAKKVEPPFATYTNGERRSELKSKAKVLQSGIVASATQALKVE